MKIALIGAGAAGAACVSVLRSRGADFCVFEKSRGVGGRLCTRRVSDVIPGHNLLFDHGCPSFRLTKKLQEQLAQLIGAHTLKQLNEREWVSTPSMPQLIKELLGSTPIQTQCEIAAVIGAPGEWYLVEKQKDNNENPRRHGPFQKVVLTAPAPQALNLLRNTEHDWAASLNDVQYSTCWVLLTSLRLSPSTEFRPSQIFSSIRCQNLIPERSQFENITNWVSCTNPDWSQQHLEQEASEVHKLLREELFRALGHEPSEILYSNVHRWRYAQVTKSLSTPYLHDSSETIFYTSDACLGNGVEGALSSGFKTGTLISSYLS